MNVVLIIIYSSTVMQGKRKVCEYQTSFFSFCFHKKERKRAFNIKKFPTFDFLYQFCDRYETIDDD